MVFLDNMPNKFNLVDDTKSLHSVKFFTRQHHQNEEKK